MYLRDKQKQVIKLENWYFIIASVKCSDTYKYYKNIKKKNIKKHFNFYLLKKENEILSSWVSKKTMWYWIIFL